MDLKAAIKGRPVGLLWLSPDCKHFSKAKGDVPKSKHIRGLAWMAVKAAATVRPRVIILENVEEFKTWGPLTKNGRPCKKRKGNTFRSFINALKFFGYAVEWRELRACDFGAPTTRKRLFLLARCDGNPIAWPEPTHGPGRSLPWRTAAEIIDWSLPCPSIFNRKHPLAESTMRRIAKGLQRFVVDNPSPFIVKINDTNEYFQWFRGREIGQGLQTVTANPGFGLTAPFLSTYYGDKNPNGDGWGRKLEEPIATQGTENRFALVAPHITKSNTSSTGHGPGVVAAFLEKAFGTQPYRMPPGIPPDRPLDTITATDHHRLVKAFLVKYNGTATGQPADVPLDTVTANDRFGLVTLKEEDYYICDIGLRMLTPRELFRAQGFPEDYVIGLEYKGRKLSKSAQVRMAGNSVCPPIAAALVRANLQSQVLEKAGD